MHKNLLKNTTNIDFGSLRWYCLIQVQLYLKVVLIQKLFFIPNNDNKDILLLKKKAFKIPFIVMLWRKLACPFHWPVLSNSLLICSSAGVQVMKLIRILNSTIFMFHYMILKKQQMNI